MEETRKRFRTSSPPLEVPTPINRVEENLPVYGALRLNPSDGNCLPFEVYNDELHAINSFLHTGKADPALLNSLLINPYDAQVFPSFSLTNRIKDLPGIITVRAKANGKYSIAENPKLPSFGEAFNWNNVILAGGSALSFIKDQRIFGDYDLFLYGLDDAAARLKIQEILSHFQSHGVTKALIRTDRVITLITQDFGTVQIILRLYSHPAEVLLGFDLPCVRLFYNGTGFWMLKSCLNAIVNGYNLATSYQPFRTGSYENRLVKYYTRGFDIRVLSFQPEKVDPAIFEGNFMALKERNGLAKLLFMLKYNISNSKSYSELRGDYDPFSLLFDFIQDMHVPGEESSHYVLDLNDFIMAVVDFYLNKPSFLIEFDPSKWHRIFDGTWTTQVFYDAANKAPHSTIIRALNDHLDTRNVKNVRPEVGPLRFIGSFQEYLRSLPEPSSWYVQAYRQ